MMNLCIPFNSIERIAHKLTANNWVTYSSKPSTPETVQQLGMQVKTAAVELVVELAHTNISTADFIGLRVGDIIATEKDIKEPLAVTVEGKRKFHATAGAFKGRTAIQVTGPVEESS